MQQILIAEDIILMFNDHWVQISYLSEDRSQQEASLTMERDKFDKIIKAINDHTPCQNQNTNAGPAEQR